MTIFRKLYNKILSDATFRGESRKAVRRLMYNDDFKAYIESLECRRESAIRHAHLASDDQKPHIWAQVAMLDDILEEIKDDIWETND